MSAGAKREGRRPAADRVCIVGGSYGGYAAAMGVIKTPELFRCAVTTAGVSDLTLLFKSSEVKADPDLRRIPVVVLTTSGAEQDILESYNLHANCYVRKPVDLDAFIEVVRSIDSFWLAIVKLPPE